MSNETPHPAPCPFCGEKDPEGGTGSLMRSRLFVECRSCGARGPMSDRSHSDAVHKWGKRPTVITQQHAKTIIEMDNVCWGEGIGPDSERLIEAIVQDYPELGSLCWKTIESNMQEGKSNAE